MWSTLRKPSQLGRKWRDLLPRRLYSNSTPNPPPPPKTATNVKPPTSNGAHSTASAEPNPSIERMHSRLPKFLRKYTQGLRNAPVSHITSFLVLHELTAIVPLIGFGAYFYKADKLPWFAEGKIFNDGVQKFGNYFRKKGWLGEDSKLGEDGQKVSASKRWTWWGRGEGGVKLVTSAAAAYALTKLLLPLRLIASVSMTPWFARTTLIPITKSIKGLFRRKKP